MTSDPNVVLAKLAGYDCDLPACVRVRHNQQFIRQQFAEAPMHLTQRFIGEDFPPDAALIDPMLNNNVSLGFELQISLFRIGTVVVFHRTLDVDRMRVVSFDEI